ncbi:MAG: GNAT family N-acetyltransferase [Trueperaceae bacterium]
MISKTTPHDVPAVLAIVGSSGQFDADALEHVEQTLEGHFATGSEALWLTADDGEIVGVAYCAPEPMTNGTWNLLMLWTRQDRHERGHGSALVKHVEDTLRESNIHLLIVENSSLDDFAPARRFYDRCGFQQEAQVRNFFAAGDDKLIYTKSLLTVNSNS